MRGKLDENEGRPGLMSVMRRAYWPVLVAIGLALMGARAGAEEILVYTSLEDDEVAVYLKDFQAKHPDIEAKVIRDSTGIITARLLAEKDNPQADAVWGLALTNLLQCDEAGALKAYDPKGLDRVKPKFRDAGGSTAHWVGIKAWETGFSSNTIEMGKLGIKAPASYEDLTKPEYKGRLVMPNPASSGTGFLMISAILQLMGEEKGWAYLDRLHENIAVYTHSGSKPAKLAGQGEYPVGISFAYRGLKQKSEGEPIEVTWPAEGSGWDIEANALVNKPRTKRGAKVFLDWAISDSAMQLYSQVFPITSVETEMPLPEGYIANPEAQLIENDFQWAAKNRERILREWSRRYEGKSER